MSTTTSPSRERDSNRDARPPTDESPGLDAPTASPAPLSRTGLAESLATACALLLCVVARVPHRLLDAAGISAWVFGLVVVIAVVSGARAVARAPFTLPRFPSTREWASVEMKTLVLGTVLGAALTVPLYTLLRATPWWWLYAGGLFAAVTVAGQLTTPFTLRLQSGPLTAAPDELADRVRAVAARAGVDVGTVMVAGKAERSGCNAYVAGLGPTRRIVLDGKLASWPPELSAQVVAHEVGHCRLGHAARRLPLAVFAQLGTLALAAAVLSWTPLLQWAGVDDAGDPRSFPLLLLLTPVLALPARCLLAWRDRHQERAADRFALDLLAAPSTFTAMLDRAASEGGAPRRLPWWRHLAASHPPIDERVQACTRFASTG